MKIGIACYPTHGGSGVVATELGIGLVNRGHEVHFFSYTTPFRLREFYENLYFHEVDVPSYPLFKHPPYALCLATKMATVADEHRLDIFHVHYAVPHAISAYLATKLTKKCRPKILTTLHGTDITLVGKDESFFEIVRYSIEQSDAVTAVSKYLRQKTVNEFGIQKPIQVIYNFINPRRCNSEENKWCRGRFAAEGEKIISHASNFRPVKRAGDVVTIFAKIRQKFAAKLLLIGEGPDLPLVNRQLRKLHLDKDVHSLGTLDYPETILTCSDLFLLPSEEESFGLAALEAMSCGCPVIGSQTGGLPEVISEGESGSLFPVGDVEGMANRAIEILGNTTLLNAMKRGARARAMAHFDADTIIGEYEKLYLDLLRRR